RVRHRRDRGGDRRRVPSLLRRRGRRALPLCVASISGDDRRGRDVHRDRGPARARLEGASGPRAGAAVAREGRMSERAEGNGSGPAGYNATTDLLERNLTPERSGRPYLRTPDRVWSYDEVAVAANGAGAGLLSLGLEQGDRIILATRDRAEF